MAKKQSATVIETKDGKGCCSGRGFHHDHGPAGFVYFLGIIGAAVYYIKHATGFWVGVLGVLKALVWPAMVVYHVLGL